MISTVRLRKRYGGVHACDDLSLAFEPGRVTAVVGPNGAGKSTLVQLLSGVIKPDSGSIRLGDADVTGKSPSALFAMGVARTFQTARVFPGLTVLDSVMVGAYHGDLYRSRAGSWMTAIGDIGASAFRLPSARDREERARARALDVIDLFGDRLSGRLDDFTYSLSYANRRRVEIARVLASRPRVLMLDEPTAGMNPTETAELATLLASVKDDNPDLTILFVEHKMDVVRRLAQRVVVMDAGRVICDGTPDEALSDPAVIEAYLGSGAHHAA
jgi:branched-chain amino acid transport system ATP-binding protein